MKTVIGRKFEKSYIFYNMGYKCSLIGLHSLVSKNVQHISKCLFKNHLLINMKRNARKEGVGHIK